MSISRKIPIVLVLYITFVFVQSLFFKFTNSPETQYIFGTLNAWAVGLGLPEVFAPDGIASQYVVGTAELVASAVLLASLLPRLRGVRPLGALLALGVISGAIFFHLFTPLGIAVVDTDGTSDGGLLFTMACGVWISAASLLWIDRDLIRSILPGSAKGRAIT
ncbi:hypothetical protein C7451_11592 [Blastomonas natatoria]|jgi:hypothetical protein|uniref:DoxX-like protein n=1 Tax=Blastomonas natatoria TaxID=34015 RepID=A0A2V3UR97_9SPHN|nr:hypothetical protein [Blastomonas natatoria]PXW69819.1 hypothetical protein C7451_11592 [Blastomonas natatoria]